MMSKFILQIWEFILNKSTTSLVMSVSYLLRQATLKRTVCSPSFVSLPYRFYAQAALAYAPVDHSQSREQNDSVAFKKPRGKKATNSKKGKLQSSNKSRRLSKTKKSSIDSAPPKDPLAATGLELYLKEIRESGSEPTLQDIERCRPECHTENVDSAQYAEEYNGLVDKLCRSFSRQQLRDFTISFNLDSRAILTKHQLAESIIEKQWKWPSLKEVQKRHRDRTEVSVKSTC